MLLLIVTYVHLQQRPRYFKDRMQQKQKVKTSSKGNRYLISFVVRDLNCWVQIIAVHCCCHITFVEHFHEWEITWLSCMRDGPILKVVPGLPGLKKKFIYNNLKNLFVYPSKIIWEHFQFFYANKIKFCFIICFTFSEYCLVVYIERDVVCNIDNETIMQWFQNMKTHRRQL